MVAPLQIFTSARAALEVTAGTPLTPTRIIYAEQFPWQQTIATIRPETLTGSYEGHPTAAAGVETNTFGMDGRLSYEDAVWLGNLFVAPLAAANGTVSAGSAWGWTFTPSNTSDNVKTATVQLGDAQAIGTATPGVSLSYVKGDSLNIHWEKNADGAVTFAATFATAGTATSLTAFTGSLSDRTTTLVSAITTQAYIDATTIGTTADSNVISVDWTLQLGPTPLYTLNGTAGATSVLRPAHRDWTATIVRQYTNPNERVVYGTKAQRFVRLTTTGPALGTATNLFQLDLRGVYDGPYSFVDTGGVITESLTLVPYAVGGTATFGMYVVNGGTVVS